MTIEQLPKGSWLRQGVHAMRVHFPWAYLLLILCANLIPAIYGILNRYFIGYMDYASVVVDQSYEALEVIFEVILEMFPIAVLALVARSYTDPPRIKGIVRSSLSLQGIICAVFLAITISFAPAFIDWLHTPAEASSLAVQYFIIKALAFPFQALSLICLITIKAMKRGWVAILLSFCSVAVNFLLDALFISNFSFSLRLGLIGSAWNNVAANILSFALSGGTVWYLLRNVKGMKIPWNASLKEIVRIGKWTGLESGVRNLGYIVGVVAVVNIIGATEPAAIGGYNTAMWVMWVITLIPVIAWTEGTNMAVGHAYGQRDAPAMKAIQIISTSLMGIYMLLWIPLGWFFWRPISEWLNADISSMVAEYSVRTFLFLIGPYILFAIGSGLKSFFIGTGKPMVIFIASAIVNLVIYLPLGSLTRTGIIPLTYMGFLLVTIIVFVVDFSLIVAFFRLKGYTTLQFSGTSS